MKFIAVPQYENLTIDTILEYGLSHRSVVDTLPAVREIKKMPRAWIRKIKQIPRASIRTSKEN